MKFIKNLPNILTLFNLFLGCMAIVYIFYDHMIIIDKQKNTYIDLGKIEFACYCIFLAAIIDFFDGFVARVLGVQSEFGKQLDSLADMVIFGVVPGIIMYQLFAKSYYANKYAFDYPILFNAIGFAITLCAALRLAKFNIDERQKTQFKGLPTPAAALIIATLPLLIVRNELELAPLLNNTWFLIIIIILLCFLMTGEITMLSMKLKSFKTDENAWQFGLLGLSILLILSGLFVLHVQFILIPSIIILYILFSITKNIAEHGI